MRAKLLILSSTFILTMLGVVHGQDASGAIAGAVSTTLHTSNSGNYKEPKRKVMLYVVIDYTKIIDSYALYNSKRYQVYRDGNKKLFFFCDNKRIYIKTVKD